MHFHFTLTLILNSIWPDVLILHLNGRIHHLTVDDVFNLVVVLWLFLVLTWRTWDVCYFWSVEDWKLWRFKRMDNRFGIKCLFVCSSASWKFYSLFLWVLSLESVLMLNTVEIFIIYYNLQCFWFDIALILNHRHR